MGVGISPKNGIDLLFGAKSKSVKGVLRRYDNVPFSKPPYTFLEITSRLELWISHPHNIDMWKSMADEGPQVLWKRAKRVITALRFGISDGSVGGSEAVGP